MAQELTDAQRARWPGIGMNSAQIIDWVVEHHGPATLIAFSGGKDSICCWLRVRERFQRAVLYYLYRVPDLEFVEEGLDYLERHHLDEPIVRMPHPVTLQYLRRNIFQPPRHLAVTAALKLESLRYDYQVIQKMVIADKGLPEQTLTAVGIRTADSMLRRAGITKRGAITLGRRQYYPVFDWNKPEIMDLLNRHGVKLPVDYDLFGRSWDGIDARFLVPLKRHRPRDYQKILEWFPFADMEVFRLEHFGGIKV